MGVAGWFFLPSCLDTAHVFCGPLSKLQQTYRHPPTVFEERIVLINPSLCPPPRELATCQETRCMTWTPRSTTWGEPQLLGITPRMPGWRGRCGATSTTTKPPPSVRTRPLPKGCTSSRTPSDPECSLVGWVSFGVLPGPGRSMAFVVCLWFSLVCVCVVA